MYKLMLRAANIHRGSGMQHAECDSAKEAGLLLGLRKNLASDLYPCRVACAPWWTARFRS